MKYSENHTWVQMDNTIGIIGITNQAQQELGEVIYIEFPSEGEKIQKGKELAVIESRKSAIDVYSPISGEIVAINQQLKKNPETIQDNAETSGWLVKIRFDDKKELDQLMDEGQYEAYLLSS